MIIDIFKKQTDKHLYLCLRRCAPTMLLQSHIFFPVLWTLCLVLTVRACIHHAW